MVEDNNIDISQTIKNEIKANDVVLFMKGTPQFPMCGFSAAVAEILSNVGVKYSSVNVLDSNEIREGIKKFSKVFAPVEYFAKSVLPSSFAPSSPDTKLVKASVVLGIFF